MLQVDPMQLIMMIKQGQNPQQLMMNILETQMQDTPLGANLLNLARNNNTAGIEQIARNLAAQKGIDFDKEFSAFKQKYFGIR